MITSEAFYFLIGAVLAGVLGTGVWAFQGGNAAMNFATVAPAVSGTLP